MYLVLPLVRAAPFELLGPWCPSFLLPGFTIDTSWCASVKRCKKTSSAFCWFLFCLFVCFFSPSSLSPLSHSPAGFSQMEVAQHSRPALHNLRMKEGGSASHYTRFEPRRWWGALVRRGAAVRTLLFFFLSRNSRLIVSPHQICVYSQNERRRVCGYPSICEFKATWRFIHRVPSLL